MKNLRYLCEYFLMASLWAVIRRLPYRGLMGFAALMGMGCFILPPYRNLILANLRTVFPELSDAERRRIGLASAKNLFRNLLESLWTSGNADRIRRCYRLPEDVEKNLKSHVAAGERILFVNPHLGNWEASGTMAPFYAGVRMVAIAKPVRNPYLNRLLNEESREKTPGLKIIFSKGAMRGAMHAVREGLGVGFLIDQNTRVRDGGTFVRFFGLEVPTSQGPAALWRYCDAHKIPAVIIYGTSVRHEDGKITAHMRYLKHRNISEYASDTEIIQEITSITEEYIRRYPEQYLWLYKRFQYRPPNLPEEQKKRYPAYSEDAPPKFFNRRPTV